MRRRLTLALTTIAVAAAATPASASARFTLSEASANRLSERYAERLSARVPWVEYWWDDCTRVTPWTFGCTISIWQNESPYEECTQTVDVELPHFGLAGYHPYIERVYRIECD